MFHKIKIESIESSKNINFFEKKIVKIILVSNKKLNNEL